MEAVASVLPDIKEAVREGVQEATPPILHALGEQIDPYEPVPHKSGALIAVLPLPKVNP